MVLGVGFLSSGDVCISATTGGMSSDTCFPDSPILSDADLFRFQFPVHHNSSSTQPFKHSPRVQLSGISCSPRVAPTLVAHMTTQKYFQNTIDATMVLDKSLNVQPDSDVHTQSHPQNVGAESMSKRQHRPNYPTS